MIANYSIIESAMNNIEAVLRLVFDAKGKAIDFQKLDASSVYYDPDYEVLLRRKDIEVLYVLGEISDYQEQGILDLIGVLTRLEAALISGQIYYDAFFINDSKGLQQLLLELTYQTALALEVLSKMGDELFVKLTRVSSYKTVYETPADLANAVRKILRSDKWQAIVRIVSAESLEPSTA